MMRTPGRQPRILLTNVKQLELLLTRQQDIQLFADARLDFLVFDEAHTFTGALGAETACLIRRLRAFCGAAADRTTCVATSATIVDHESPDAARGFAGAVLRSPRRSGGDGRGRLRRRGVGRHLATRPVGPGQDAAGILDRCVLAVDDEEDPDAAVRSAYRALSGDSLPAGDWPGALHAALSRNELVFRLNEELRHAESARRVAARS